MKSSVRWAVFALAMLIAAPCLAQGTPPDTLSRGGSSPGRGGIGGLIGGSSFYASEDFSTGAQIRFSFDAHFRYTFTSRFRGQFSPGFTWSAYSKAEPPPFFDPAHPEDVDKEGHLAQLVPMSVQLQYLIGSKPWLYYVGVGPGLYRVTVQNDRKVVRDPDPSSLAEHRNLFYGFTVEAGAEHFLRSLPSTSAELAIANHYVMSEDKEKFPSGWNTNIGALALRIGVNYYFDLNRPKKTEELPPGVR